MNNMGKIIYLLVNKVVTLELKSSCLYKNTCVREGEVAPKVTETIQAAQNLSKHIFLYLN